MKSQWNTLKALPVSAMIQSFYCHMNSKEASFPVTTPVASTEI